MQKSQTRRAGGVEYTLYRKDIKNMYIRINRAGEVVVTANRRVPLGKIDEFVGMNSDKIAARLARPTPVLPQVDKAECQKLFEGISRRIYPMFSGHLKEMPKIEVKNLTATWGICHPTKNYISLSSRLYSKPVVAVEYVILHEYAHFIYPNHQKEFYNFIEKIMPDYRERAALLKN